MATCSLLSCFQGTNCPFPGQISTPNYCHTPVPRVRNSGLPPFRMGLSEDENQCPPFYLFYLLWVPCCRICHASRPKITRQIAFLSFSSLFSQSHPASPPLAFERPYKCSFLSVGPQKSCSLILKTHSLPSLTFPTSLYCDDCAENTLPCPAVCCAHLPPQKRSKTLQ